MGALVSTTAPELRLRTRTQIRLAATAIAQKHIIKLRDQQEKTVPKQVTVAGGMGESVNGCYFCATP